MRKNRWLWMMALSVVMSLLLGMTAFAATWRTGVSPNEARWWYDNEDGTYARDGWYWLDGNRDGVAECYYFDRDGWMAAGTATPDGYEVNENGAWIQDGAVMTQAVETQTPVEPEGNGNELVVYFSRTGTTERAAQRIGELTGAAVVEIEAAQPYSGSYDATLARAERELDSNARPAVTTTIENMEQYDILYVGYPIWYGTAPMPVFTFLESYDLSGKTIVPFCTSGSSGVGPSVADIRQSCPDSTVLDGRRVNDTGSIEGWLSSLGL